MKLLSLLLFIATPKLYAGDIYVHKGETSTVLINNRLGTLVEFAHPIKVVSDSAHFRIEQVATEVTKKGKPVNVRIVKVKPRSGGTRSETIPFVLTGKRSITLRFVSQRDAPKHQRIRFPSSRSNNLTSSGVFLSSEISLMRQMLKDETGEGFQRSVIKENLAIEGYDDKLDLLLVRRFEGKGLFGYTFKVINTTKDELTINPHALNFGSPNKAALLQMDHETLAPCSQNNSPAPGSGSCVAALRLVVRGDNFVKPSKGSDLPFRIGSGG